MKFTVVLNNLKEKLPFLGRVVSNKSQLPILLNILIEAKKGKIFLNVTDLEIGIQTTIPANIQEEGGITTPAKTFIDLINTLSSEKITIQTDKNKLEVLSEKTKSSFQTVSVEEFPKLYEEKGKELFVIKKEDLQKDFPRVLFAASFDTSRPALSGIYVKKESATEKQTILVATDGYRLSLKNTDAVLSKTKKEKNLLEQAVIVPVRILKELLFLKEGDGEVGVFVAEGKNQILFELGETIIVGRLINAQFPIYEKIIPQESTLKAVFDREEMLRAVKMSAIFARDAANIIRFSIKGNNITVSANAPQVGENSVEVEAKITGDENEIAFNARYLLEFFNIIEEEDIIFEMTTPTSPGVFKIKGDPTFLHLIMPIKVQEQQE